MKVNEIFTSLQGEGPEAGKPAVFLRLQGCNLRCKWCDTKYALDDVVDHPDHQVTSIVSDLLARSNSKLLIITGGEPLLQLTDVTNIVDAMTGSRYRVAIETNGTMPVPQWWRRVVWDVDWKCPSARVDVEFNKAWLLTGPDLRLKFVVADSNDLMYVIKALDVIKHEASQLPEVIVSPASNTDASFDQRWLKDVWRFCTDYSVRFSLQTHKIVFGNQRGV